MHLSIRMSNKILGRVFKCCVPWCAAAAGSPCLRRTHWSAFLTKLFRWITISAILYRPHPTISSSQIRFAHQNINSYKVYGFGAQPVGIRRVAHHHIEVACAGHSKITHKTFKVAMQSNTRWAITFISSNFMLFTVERCRSFLLRESQSCSDRVHCRYSFGVSTENLLEIVLGQNFEQTVNFAIELSI